MSYFSFLMLVQQLTAAQMYLLSFHWEGSWQLQDKLLLLLIAPVLEFGFLASRFLLLSLQSEDSWQFQNKSSPLLRPYLDGEGAGLRGLKNPVS